MTVYLTLLYHTSSDNNLTKRDSVPNIQVTENGDLNNSPISILGNKLKLDKALRRRDRPKGTKKKTLTELSEKNEVNRQTNYNKLEKQSQKAKNEKYTY